MTLLYISGPMSGLPDHNFPAFFAAEKLLRRAGYDVINPAQKGIVDGWKWEDYLRHDLAELLTVDGIAVLRGHTRSRGARLEVHVARQLGMTVMPVMGWVSMARVEAVAA